MTATTHTTLTKQLISPTHMLIICPRGFANERQPYAIPADLVACAEEFVSLHNPEGQVSQTRILAYRDAHNDDKFAVGRLLNEVGASDYRVMLEQILNC